MTQKRIPRRIYWEGGVIVQIFSFSPFGYEGALVSVEVDLRRGIPAVDIVGLADGAVKESRERMRSAIRNSGFEFPPERVLISLSPADLRKEGAGFDLAVALAVLHGKLGTEQADGAGKQAPVLVMGELELNGRVRPVRGVYAAVSTAYAGGIRQCIVPAENCREAREVPGMRVFGAERLTDAFAALQDKSRFAPAAAEGSGTERGILPGGAEEIEGIAFGAPVPGFAFEDIRGQAFLVRGLQIAAAGGHNLLAFGPPGCGKTLALQRFPALLPLLTPEEAQAVTRIYSLAGLLPPERAVMRSAPFRQPHQTASMEGMCGGGSRCSPGEISLAHNGVLFLDEAAEFRTSVLQMLRVPLESGSVTLSRAGRSTVYPAAFQLLMATNPCPCGNFGSPDKLCLCSAHSVELYWRKFSAPLLDRIDIRVHVESRPDSTAQGSTPPPDTRQLRVQVARATAAQRRRQGGKKNARLSPSEIAAWCPLPQDARLLLDEACRRSQLSPRATAACIKLARTIADMEGKEQIDEASVQEAVLYRGNGGDIGIF